MDTYYTFNNVPDEFLGQPLKKKKKRKKKKNDVSMLGQYFSNQNIVKAWAIKTNTIPGLLTKDKVLSFNNRILTKTLPRDKTEIANTRGFVNALATSQKKVNVMNRRLLIDQDDPIRQDLIDAFVAEGSSVVDNENEYEDNDDISGLTEIV